MNIIHWAIGATCIDKRDAVSASLWVPFVTVIMVFYEYYFSINLYIARSAIRCGYYSVIMQ